MTKASGTTVPGATSHGVPPIRARAQGVRPSRAWWWALAGLIGLTTAGQIGLIVAIGSWLRSAPTVAGSGTPEPVPGSGAARGDASGGPAATRNVATAHRGPAPEPERPPSLPVESRAPQPPQDNGLPPAAGPPEAPRSVAGAADHRPGDSMLAEARLGPVLPAAGAADPPGGGCPLAGAGALRPAVAARRHPLPRRRRVGAGLQRDLVPGLPQPGGARRRGPRPRERSAHHRDRLRPHRKKPVVINGVTYSVRGWETRSGGLLTTAAPDLTDLVNIHPGFRDARSVVLHQFGVDPDYSRFRETFRTSAHDRRGIG